MISDTAVENPGTRRRLRIAVICRELGGRGSVPTVAIRQAQELGRYARVTLLSDSFPDNTDSSLFRHLVTPANLSCLRGFSHVPRELAFAIAVKCGLFRLQEQGAELAFVHCHGHSLVAIAASSFRRRFRVPCGLVAHGDVFSSAPGTYDFFLIAGAVIRIVAGRSKFGGGMDRTIIGRRDTLVGEIVARPEQRS
jgi:hypothetical protein